MHKTLPEEIWCRIFSLTLPGAPNFSPHNSPTVLTHVCKSWRRISVSYPFFWSKFSLALIVKPVTEGTVELCKLWLARSGACPLDVDLRVPFDALPWSIGTNDTEGRILGEIMDLVSQHAHRLKSVLRAYPQILYNALEEDTMPLLEELFIVDPPEGELLQFPVRTLPPRLKSLAMFNTYAHFSPATLWPQLQHLELWQTDAGLAGLSPSDCLHILSQLPSLVSAGFHICVEDDEPVNHQAIKVKLPALRHLVISTYPEHNLEVLFKNLDTPILHSVGFDGCVSRAFYRLLAIFLAQCRRTLRLLALGQVGIVDVGLLAALASCPSSARAVLCSSSFDGHAASRIGSARQKEHGLKYDDLRCTQGCPPHTLSYAFLSDEMWSNILDHEESFHFPARTFRDIDLWVPSEMWMPALNRMEDRPDEEEFQSVQVSICKGSSVFHSGFCDTWVS